MNVKIVAVEGLDGSGKSTFARKLYEAVARNIPADLEFGVIFQHFPDYDSPTGKEIKDRLKNGDFKSSKFLNELIHLFMANRYDWWVNNYWRFRKRYPMLMIVDRYRLSNLYTMLPRFEDCDTIGQLAQRIDYMNELEFNMHRVVKEDLDVVLWCPVELRLQRLAERAEREAINYLDSEMMDITEMIRDTLLAAQPLSNICKPDCQGLCPVCGADLNEGRCSCEASSPDPRLAVLQQFMNKE